MRDFHVALTGDFLDEAGNIPYGYIGLDLLDAEPAINYTFLQDLAPQPNDPDYWNRFYSLEVVPEHIADIEGLIVLHP